MNWKSAARVLLKSAPVVQWSMCNAVAKSITTRRQREQDNTLRTTRELYRQEGFSSRPWDLAIWSGVTPQGTRNSLRRLEAIGLVRALRPDRPGRAPSFALDRTHPLYQSLAGLFQAEREMLRR